MNPLYGDTPFRDTFWSIPHWAQLALYAGAAIALAVCFWGIAQRARLWLGGRPEMRWDHIPTRVGLVIKYGLLQMRVLSQSYPGVMHATVFWGFLALFMGTVLATIDYDFTLPLLGVKILKGPFYLFYELSVLAGWVISRRRAKAGELAAGAA